MKKIFIIGIFILISFIGGASTISAQEIKEEKEEVEDVMTEEEVATEGAMLEASDYQLPYPGILPDHPLYKLKMLRDRILELLTTDQIKKAKFYLLQSDKRLAASILLDEKGNEPLAETTSSKGLDYLEKAINTTREVDSSQKSVDDIILQINSSSQKHREEIEKLKDQTAGDISKRFEAQYQRAQALEKVADQLSP